MKKIKFLSVLLMLALANFALISCGSDDDGETGGASSGAPYTGVWTAVEMQIVEDGESYGGPIPAGYVMRLTLGEDGKYEYYYYSPGEDGDEPETITESGYWTFDKESSKIVGVIDDENKKEIIRLTKNYSKRSDEIAFSYYMEFRLSI